MRRSALLPPLTAPAGTADIALMRPLLPSAEDLLPWLRRIDERRIYSNFGPLQDELLQALLALQAALDGKPVQGVLTCNATQGLELALTALDLPPQSRIAVPALTFPATATAVQRCGHVPVVFDVDPASWLLTPECLPADPAAAGIAAVMPVSTFGMPQDAQAWSRWSRRHGVAVVIDAAAAFGAQASAPGVTAVFSLHATKPLSCGEGGLIVTRERALAARLRALSNFGIGGPATGPATNAKMSEYHAAVGLAHLAQWPGQVQARRQVLRAYHQGLAPALKTALSLQRDTGLHAPSVLTVRLQTPALRDALERALAAQQIQTRRWYLPLLTQTPALGPLESAGPLPVAHALSQQLLGLPFFPDLAPAQIDRVCSVVRSLVCPPELSALTSH